MEYYGVPHAAAPARFPKYRVISMNVCTSGMKLRLQRPSKEWCWAAMTERSRKCPHHAQTTSADRVPALGPIQMLPIERAYICLQKMDTQRKSIERAQLRRAIPLQSPLVNSAGIKYLINRTEIAHCQCDAARVCLVSE